MAPRRFRTPRLRWTQLFKYSIIITGVAIIITCVDITTMGGGGTINPVGTTTIGVIIITVSRGPATEQRQGGTFYQVSSWRFRLGVQGP